MVMSNGNKDLVLQIDKLMLDLRKKLEVLLKWRAECAEMQVEFLKLYAPECLEILESLKQTDDIHNISDNE